MATRNCKLYIFEVDDGTWRAEDPWNVNNNITAKNLDTLLDRLKTRTNKRKFDLLRSVMK